MSSLLLLIDGYNVVAPVAPPSRDPGGNWLQRERMQLIQRLIQHLPVDVRERTCVVFDAANPPKDRSSQFQLGGIEVRFSVGYAEADDLLEELIAAHSAPKQLTVVSSDHRVQSAARRRGSSPFESQEWLDDLLDGVVRVIGGRGSRHEDGEGQGSENEKPEVPPQEDHEVESWMREFGF